MLRTGGMVALGGASLAALALMLAPAAASSGQTKKAKRPRAAVSLSNGSFTPAVADPRLAAEFVRRGLQSSGFRLTPSTALTDKSKAIRVAVRAKSANTAATSRTLAETSASAVTAATPTAYNLGVSVGWKRFALSGDVAKVEGGAAPGGREAAELDLSYSIKKFTGSIQVGAERTDGKLPRITPDEHSYSLGVGGSYRLTRNLDVTGGVRYRIQSDRLDSLADDRRDSQAVYVGTAFRF